MNVKVKSSDLYHAADVGPTEAVGENKSSYVVECTAITSSEAVEKLNEWVEANTDHAYKNWVLVDGKPRFEE